MDLNITQEAAGHTADGLPLSIYTLCNRQGMAVRIGTLGAALLSLHAPDRHGLLANVLRSGLAGDGIHLLPAPGRALHRLAWHAVPLLEDARVGVRLVSPGTPAVVARYLLDDANTLTLQCEVSAATPASLSLPVGFELDGQLLTVQAQRVIPAGAHAQAVAGTSWDCRSARPVAALAGAARFLAGPGQALALRLADPATGRQLELAGDLASLRVACGEPAGCLLVEPALDAPGGTIAFHFSAQA
ncbi:MAG: galactose-epimerase [Pseudoduganella sp.]|jgi:hypothetical protein|nr:galactose-epimerase [Pseudoduganella sp.]